MPAKRGDKDHIPGIAEKLYQGQELIDDEPAVYARNKKKVDAIVQLRDKVDGGKPAVSYPTPDLSFLNPMSGFRALGRLLGRREDNDN